MYREIQRLVGQITVLFHVLYEQRIGIKVLLLLVKRKKNVINSNKYSRKFFSGAFKNLTAFAIIK